MALSSKTLSRMRVYIFDRLDKVCDRNVDVERVTEDLVHIMDREDKELIRQDCYEVLRHYLRKDPATSVLSKIMAELEYYQSRSKSRSESSRSSESRSSDARYSKTHSSRSSREERRYSERDERESSSRDSSRHNSGSKRVRDDYEDDRKRDSKRPRLSSENVNDDNNNNEKSENSSDSTTSNTSNSNNNGHIKEKKENTKSYDNRNSKTNPNSPAFKTSCTLLLVNVPNDKLNIVSLTSHFAQFGSITDISIKTEDSRAFVRFSTHEEAERAVSSPVPILDNRFIHIYWATDKGSSSTAIATPQPIPGPPAKHNLPPKPTTQSIAPPSSSTTTSPSTSVPSPSTNITPVAFPPIRPPTVQKTRGFLRPAPSSGASLPPAAANASFPSRGRPLAQRYAGPPARPNSNTYKNPNVKISRDFVTQLQQQSELRKRLSEQLESMLNLLSKETDPEKQMFFKETIEKLSETIKNLLEKEKLLVEKAKISPAVSTRTNSTVAPKPTPPVEENNEQPIVNQKAIGNTDLEDDINKNVIEYDDALTDDIFDDADDDDERSWRR